MNRKQKAQLRDEREKFYRRWERKLKIKFMKFVVKQNKKTKQYSWKLVADNNEIVAHGESYTQKHNCIDAIKLVQGSNNMYFIEDTTK